MAIGGGVTTAYWCRAEEDRLVKTSTSALWSSCVSPQEALPRILAGETVRVAGADVIELDGLWANREKGGGQ